MEYTQAAMGFLASVPERPATAESAAQTPTPVSAGPASCVSLRCREPGLYLMGGYVLCERHMRDSVRSYMSASKETRDRHPHVLYCADGFKTVECGGREDHRALGAFERVQVCAPARADACKAIFPVHWLWVGKPMPCPQCAAAAYREVYPERVSGDGASGEESGAAKAGCDGGEFPDGAYADDSLEIAGDRDDTKEQEDDDA
jgi:hypothetical protein